MQLSRGVGAERRGPALGWFAGPGPQPQAPSDPDFAVVTLLAERDRAGLVDRLALDRAGPKERAYELRWQKRDLWEPDYRLEFWKRHMVDVYGEVREGLIDVERIEPILTKYLLENRTDDE